MGNITINPESNSNSQDKYDAYNKANFLRGKQIKALKGFLASKDEGEIAHLGTVYYIAAKYWPQELADELRKSSTGSTQKVENEEIIEKNRPLQHFSSGNCNWEKISETIEVLEAVRKNINNQARR